MSESSAAPQPEAPGPAHGQLSLWDTVSIIVGIVIGTSIFKIPWLVFANVSDPWTGLLVWAFGGLLALVGGLCYAELGTTYPRSGGDYVYLTRAYGPWVGFLFGWGQLVIVFTANIGAMAFVFGENAAVLFDPTQYVEMGLTPQFFYAILAVVAISVMNIVGVQAGKWTQNVLTVAKILGLGAIVIAGFFWGESNPAEWEFAEPAKIGWGGLAMILVLFAYGGWNDAAFVAAEVRNGKRNIPLALILGIGLITLIYILINAAYLVGLGFETARVPGGLPQKLLEKALPSFGAKAITILIMISALGAVNGLTFTGARVYAMLGNDYRLFGWLGHWQPGRRAPVLALIAQAVITLGMIFTLCTKTGHETINDILNGVGIRYQSEWKPDDAFEILVSHSAPIFWVFFLLTGMSLFLLREKDRGIDRPFTAPLYPFLPVIFCQMCVYMLYQSTIYVGFRSLFAVALVMLGLPLFLIAQLMGGYRGRSSAA